MTLTIPYSFMDLMKFYGKVPAAIQEQNSFINEIETGFQTFMDFVEDTTDDYDFINLVQDKGLNVVSIKDPANDNEPEFRKAS
ncbi:MAG: hypothetical protein H6912_00465 [Kordiimonadaceae bacterium]|nr:hypothetical protein [Kordiimonadaceae bacterium]